MFLRLLSSIALLAMLCPFANADDSEPKKNEIEVLRQQGYSVKTITPIFGQHLDVLVP